METKFHPQGKDILWVGPLVVIGGPAVVVYPGGVKSTKPRASAVWYGLGAGVERVNCDQEAGLGPR